VEWSSSDVAKVIETLGFLIARQEGHDTYAKDGHPRVVSIPRNKKSIPIGTIGSIWRQAGITAKQARDIREGRA
jgi:predicted RNA binding protein YcfA (HicA-like mRNA interferase family)